MGGSRVKTQTNFQLNKCCAERRFVSNDDDRISQLPDDILVDILSLLPLKEAARTSVLSGRWINLWKHTHALNFDAESVIHKIYEHHRLLKSERPKYVKWVNSVVESHESPTLKEFRIHFPLNKSSKKSITRWLEFAFSRQVQRLELDFDNYIYSWSKDYRLPNYLNNPSTLVNFNKSLKALSLTSVCVSDGDIEFFLRNCPRLEQLIVRYSREVSKIEVCGPSSLMLKHLEIVFCPGLKSLKVVSLPRLTTLSVTSLKGLLIEDVPMLVNVSVHCGDDGISIDHLFNDVLSCCIFQLETLCLGLHNNEQIIRRDELCKLPEMPKLKKLDIEYSGTCDDCLVRLAAFIRASPQLEELVLQYKRHKLPREDGEVKDAIRIAQHHLKIFKFFGYYGSASDAELLNYILENCVVLEKIIIDPDFSLSCDNDKLEVEDTARKNAKQHLEPLVPRHVELVVL